MKYERIFTVGLDHIPPTFGVVTKLVGENYENLAYIQQSTGVKIEVIGKGSREIDKRTGRPSENPLQIVVRHGDSKEFEVAETLVDSLIKRVHAMFQTYPKPAESKREEPAPSRRESGHKRPHEDRYCKYCDVNLSEEMYTVHCSGALHLQRVEEYDRRRGSSRRSGSPPPKKAASQAGGDYLSTLRNRVAPERLRNDLQTIFLQQISPTHLHQLRMKNEERVHADKTSVYNLLAGSRLTQTPTFCKLCQKKTGLMNDHLRTEQHSENYLMLQIRLGLHTFAQAYGDVPFMGMDTQGGRKLATEAIEFKRECLPRDREEAHLYREMAILTGELSRYYCNVCRMSHTRLRDFIWHILSDAHAKDCIKTMTDMGVSGASQLVDVVWAVPEVIDNVMAEKSSSSHKKKASRSRKHKRGRSSSSSGSESSVSSSTSGSSDSSSGAARHRHKSRSASRGRSPHGRKSKRRHQKSSSGSSSERPRRKSESKRSKRSRHRSPVRKSSRRSRSDSRSQTSSSHSRSRSPDERRQSRRPRSMSSVGKRGRRSRSPFVKASKTEEAKQNKLTTTFKGFDVSSQKSVPLQSPVTGATSSFSVTPGQVKYPPIGVPPQRYSERSAPPVDTPSPAVPPYPPTSVPPPGVPPQGYPPEMYAAQSWGGMAPNMPHPDSGPYMYPNWAMDPNVAAMYPPGMYPPAPAPPAMYPPAPEQISYPISYADSSNNAYNYGQASNRDGAHVAHGGPNRDSRNDMDRNPGGAGGQGSNERRLSRWGDDRARNQGGREKEKDGGHRSEPRHVEKERDRDRGRNDRDRGSKQNDRDRSHGKEHRKDERKDRDQAKDRNGRYGRDDRDRSRDRQKSQRRRDRSRSKEQQNQSSRYRSRSRDRRDRSPKRSDREKSKDRKERSPRRDRKGTSRSRDWRDRSQRMSDRGRSKDQWNRSAKRDDRGRDQSMKKDTQSNRDDKQEKDIADADECCPVEQCEKKDYLQKDGRVSLHLLAKHWAQFHGKTCLLHCPCCDIKKPGFMDLYEHIVEAHNDVFKDPGHPFNEMLIVATEETSDNFADPGEKSPPEAIIKYLPVQFTRTVTGSENNRSKIKSVLENLKQDSVTDEPQLTCPIEACKSWENKQTGKIGALNFAKHWTRCHMKPRKWYCPLPHQRDFTAMEAAELREHFESKHEDMFSDLSLLDPQLSGDAFLSKVPIMYDECKTSDEFIDPGDMLLPASTRLLIQNLSFPRVLMKMESTAKIAGQLLKTWISKHSLVLEEKKKDLPNGTDKVESEEVKIYTCPVKECCGADALLYFSAAVLADHWVNKHTRIPYKFHCPLCSFSVSNVVKLKTHLCEKHADRFSDYKQAARYIRECPIIFSELASRAKIYVDPKDAELPEDISEILTPAEPGEDTACIHILDTEENREKVKSSLEEWEKKQTHICSTAECANIPFRSSHIEDYATHWREKHYVQPSRLSIRCFIPGCKHCVEGMRGLKQHMKDHQEMFERAVDMKQAITKVPFICEDEPNPDYIEIPLELQPFIEKKYLPPIGQQDIPENWDASYKCLRKYLKPEFQHLCPEGEEPESEPSAPEQDASETNVIENATVPSMTGSDEVKPEVSGLEVPDTTEGQCEEKTQDPDGVVEKDMQDKNDVAMKDEVSSGMNKEPEESGDGGNMSGTGEPVKTGQEESGPPVEMDQISENPTGSSQPVENDMKDANDVEMEKEVPHGLNKDPEESRDGENLSGPGEQVGTEKGEVSSGMNKDAEESRDGENMSGTGEPAKTGKEELGPVEMDQDSENLVSSSQAVEENMKDANDVEMEDTHSGEPNKKSESSVPGEYMSGMEKPVKKEKEESGSVDLVETRENLADSSQPVAKDTKDPTDVEMEESVSVGQNEKPEESAAGENIPQIEESVETEKEGSGPVEMDEDSEKLPVVQESVESEVVSVSGSLADEQAIKDHVEPQDVEDASQPGTSSREQSEDEEEISSVETKAEESADGDKGLKASELTSEDGGEVSESNEVVVLSKAVEVSASHQEEKGKEEKEQPMPASNMKESVEGKEGDRDTEPGSSSAGKDGEQNEVGKPSERDKNVPVESDDLKDELDDSGLMDSCDRQKSLTSDVKDEITAKTDDGLQMEADDSDITAAEGDLSSPQEDASNEADVKNLDEPMSEIAPVSENEAHSPAEPSTSTCGNDRIDMEAEKKDDQVGDGDDLAGDMNVAGSEEDDSRPSQKLSADATQQDSASESSEVDKQVTPDSTEKPVRESVPMEEAGEECSTSEVCPPEQDTTAEIEECEAKDSHNEASPVPLSSGNTVEALEPVEESSQDISGSEVNKCESLGQGAEAEGTEAADEGNSDDKTHAADIESTSAEPEEESVKEPCEEASPNAAQEGRADSSLEPAKEDTDISSGVEVGKLESTDEDHETGKTEEADPTLSTEESSSTDVVSMEVESTSAAVVSPKKQTKRRTRKSIKAEAKVAEEQAGDSVIGSDNPDETSAAEEECESPRKRPRRKRAAKK